MADSDDRSGKEADDLRARERLRYQWMLDSVSKFRFFFVGLVFATLSFSLQSGVSSTNRSARLCQFAAWGLLLLTGVFALRDAGGLVSKNTEDVFDGLAPTARRVMWAAFLLALVLQIVVRAIS
jgi:cytochrome bd-type quinol oxidase subunit 2